MVNDETNAVQGSGATLDEALADAHDRVTSAISAEMKTSRVFDVSMTTGGFTGGRMVYVRVHPET